MEHVIFGLGIRGGSLWQTSVSTQISTHKQMEIWRRGGRSLTDSSQAISRLIDAQKAEYWSEEAGFKAMRRSLITYLRTENDVVSNQKVRFQKFDGDVDTAVSALKPPSRVTPMSSPGSSLLWTRSLQAHPHPLRRRHPRRSRAGAQHSLEMPTVPRRLAQVVVVPAPAQVPRRTRRLRSEKERNHHG